ncbi:hypothetical protein RJE46_10805 [Cedecea neteri]|uniref:hypothetical protein n=1 Tax=Cedecea neteri TaxID=158822 RepID=UPI0028931E71|nr:hypothetical protein [Cedecea neteri]WNJ81685.1 hypothetical protein RJE46_10805 [Cedecea neteri]
MANQTKKQNDNVIPPSIDELNAGGDATAVIEDLNAGENTVPANQNSDVVSDGSEGGRPGGEHGESQEQSAPEYVVLKGNSIRHDGEIYRENEIILVEGKDADRLLAGGVIGDVEALRRRALLSGPAVSVTSE